MILVTFSVLLFIFDASLFSLQMKCFKKTQNLSESMFFCNTSFTSSFNKVRKKQTLRSETIHGN